MVDSFEKELRKILLEAECRFVRAGKGSHEIWFSPKSNQTFAVPQTKSRHTANEVLKQAGLAKRF